MSDDSSVRKREEPTESLFSKDEASYPSRPTPLAPPPSDELRDFGREPIGTPPSHAAPPATPSSRPTIVPSELPSFPYTSSEAPPDTINDACAERVEDSMVDFPRPNAPPLAVISIEAPTRRRSGRGALARAVFALAFGWVLGLAGYVFRPRLALALHELQTRIPILATLR